MNVNEMIFALLAMFFGEYVLLCISIMYCYYNITMLLSFYYYYVMVFLCLSPIPYLFYYVIVFSYINIIYIIYIIGLSLNGMVIGSIMSLVTDASEEKSRIYRNIESLSTYLRDNSVPR
jgi:hypothetical protein